MKDYDTLIQGEEVNLADAEKRHEEINDSYKALVSTMKDKQDARDQLQQELQKAQQEAARAKEEVHATVSQLQAVKHEVSKIQLDLAEMKREKKILELVERQASYWDVLEMRIEQRRRDLDFGLEGITDSEKTLESIMANIRQITERGGFSHQAVDARSGEAIYKQYIREICEMAVDGNEVPFAKKEERINIIDRFLNMPRILPLWN